MTTALCFNCGETKFGAWCPCAKCGAVSSGDKDLDVMFSDHYVAVSSLQELGSVMKELVRHCDDPTVRLCAFLSHLSTHSPSFMTTQVPQDLAAGVEELLAEVQLPIVQVKQKSPLAGMGLPEKILPFPEPLFHKYAAATGFSGPARVLASVQVRRKDGSVIRGMVAKSKKEAPQILVDTSIEITPEDIVAVRPAPGCLLGWLFAPKWIEVD